MGFQDECTRLERHIKRVYNPSAKLLWRDLYRRAVQLGAKPWELKQPGVSITDVVEFVALLDGEQPRANIRSEPEADDMAVEMERLAAEAAKYGVQVRTIEKWERLAPLFRKRHTDAQIRELLLMPDSTLRDNKRKMRDTGYWADYVESRP